MKITNKDAVILSHRVDEGVFTWKKMLDCLGKLTEEQLQQPAMLLPPNPTPAHSLLEPILCIGTVEELCHVDGDVCHETRGPDFQHHPEQVVALRDWAPFDEEGNTSFTMEEGGMRGNKTGKLYK